MCCNMKDLRCKLSTQWEREIRYPLPGPLPLSMPPSPFSLIPASLPSPFPSSLSPTISATPTFAADQFAHTGAQEFAKSYSTGGLCTEALKIHFLDSEQSK